MTIEPNEPEYKVFTVGTRPPSTASLIFTTAAGAAVGYSVGKGAVEAAEYGCGWLLLYILQTIYVLALGAFGFLPSICFIIAAFMSDDSFKYLTHGVPAMWISCTVLACFALWGYTVLLTRFVNRHN
jgi:hypothetical protein